MQAFINAHVHATKSDGPDLVKRFHVNAFPTLIVVDATGAEIDRFLGYRTPEPFLKEIDRILRGEDTLMALKKRAAQAPDDLDAAINLANKTVDSDPGVALTTLDALIAKAHEAKDAAHDSRAWRVKGTALGKEGQIVPAVEAFEHLVAEFPESEAAGQAAVRGQFLFLRLSTSDAPRALTFFEKSAKAARTSTDKVAAEHGLFQVHMIEAGKALARQAKAAADDPQALNETAWAAFEHKLQLGQALAWARAAVESSKRDPAILDTLANLLFATGHGDEAITIEEEAFNATPEGPMKADFAANIAMWTAARDARKASGHEVIPATPLVPAPK